MRAITGLAMSAMLAASACGGGAQRPAPGTVGPDPALGPPQLGGLPTVNIAPAEGWAGGETPDPAPGLAVNAFAAGLDHPRWLHVLPNGDVLVAEANKQPAPPQGLRGLAERVVMGIAGAEAPSADRITLLRDADGDGVAEGRTVLLDDLTSPFGMALLGGHLYVANTDALVRVPFRAGQTRVDAAPEVVVRLPAGGPNRHWTKGLEVGSDGRLYVSVGSNSDHGETGMEAERNRAAIWAVDPATGGATIFASGLRNPVGTDVNPETGTLWTVVNERDELGDDLVPDYLTAVREGAFYGWPWVYWGDVMDPRVDGAPPALARAPDYALGAHVAPLGLTFAEGAALGPGFGQGAFIGQHGSWNRRPASGYSVVFVPFAGGRPAGDPVDVLTGFRTEDGAARGRPVGVEIAGDGALLVADDVGNVIWRVTEER